MFGTFLLLKKHPKNLGVHFDAALFLSEKTASKNLCRISNIKALSGKIYSNLRETPNDFIRL